MLRFIRRRKSDTRVSVAQCHRSKRTIARSQYPIASQVGAGVSAGPPKRSLLLWMTQQKVNLRSQATQAGGTTAASNCLTNLLHEGRIDLPKNCSLKARKNDADI